MTVKDQDGTSLPRLVEIMRRLLAPDGCPWDREQSFASIKKYVIEEAFEVVDAVDALGPDGEHLQGPATTHAPDARAVMELREELGDLLLQVIFLSQLSTTRGWFGVDDVVAGISDKLERRHPHVFGDLKVTGSTEVLANWEKLKAAEKKNRRTLDGMPRHLPALMYAFRLGEKAGNVGFDWPDAQGPRQKIDEEVRELDEAIASGDRDRIEHELGDVLFSVVNVARKHGVAAEDALKKANRRFEERFRHVEERALQDGRSMKEHTLAELDAYWNDAKQTK